MRFLGGAETVSLSLTRVCTVGGKPCYACLPSFACLELCLCQCKALGVHPW